MKTIGIFPAAGGLGGSTYRHLLKLVRCDRVILICRKPETIPLEYVQAGVRVRRASYEDSPAELEVAFAGIDVLFLISYPSHVHQYRVQVQLPAVDAAARAGVCHVLYSSLAFAGPADSHESRAVVMQAHLDTENHLQVLSKAAGEAQGSSSGRSFRYTAIREGLYAESTGIYTAFYKRGTDGSNEVRIPHDGSAPGVAWIKKDELGEATARLIAAAAASEEEIQATPALASAARYIAENDVILLTGPRAWTLAETVAAVFNDAETKAPVRIRQVSIDEFVAQPAVKAVFGTDNASEKARTWATAWDGIRNGETAVVTKAVADILGREPTPAF